MCSPSPPPPPDYAGAAREQGAANVEAARTQGRINNPNYINPYGRQTVTWDGDTPTVTQELSEQERAIYDANARNRLGLGNLANQGIDALSGLIGTELDFSGLGDEPEIFDGGTDLSGEAFSPGGRMPSTLDPSSFGAMPTIYGGAKNLPAMPEVSEAIRERVIGAMMGRADQDFAKRREQQQADLVARGLAPGTEAFQREMDMLERSRNDARQQAELAGGNAAAQAFGMDLSRRKQGYDEGLTDAQTIYDQMMGVRKQGVGEQATRFGQEMDVRRTGAAEQAQRFGQLGQAGELRMRGQSQRNSQQGDLRRQKIAEILAKRQTPLNEIIALMGGSGVNNPFAVGGYNGNSTVAPAPIFGAASAQGQWDQNAYNQKVGSFNNMMSGLFGVGSAFMKPSDRRLKSNIKRLGTHPLGVGIYEYDIAGRREIGVMAQEVQAVKPEAVSVHPEGFLMVDYGRL
jgi:hypothetical protein